ncbi:hypothetical protein FBU59_000834, partial [Linderina macrospora]
CTRLLLAIGSVQPKGIGELVDVIVLRTLESAEDTHERTAPLLCLLAELLGQYPDESFAALTANSTLRRFNRHIIKLLSAPSPSVTAPTLHILTQVLLHSNCAVPSPLTIIAESLRPKLFDESHIDRTLVLVADLCLNCKGAENSLTVDEDLKVLDSIAGVVRAVVTSKAAERFFQSTRLVGALGHVALLANLNRRYMFPLLRIINPILAAPASVGSPLVAGLIVPQPSGSNGAGGVSPIAVVPDVFDAILSGIEDAVYTVPQSLSMAALDGIPWPRIACDESGSGWFVNCDSMSRSLVVEFVVAVLNSHRLEDSELLKKDLVQVASQAVSALLPASDSNGPLDPFAIHRSPNANGAEIPLAEFADTASRVERASARYQYSTLAYYWVVKPVLDFAGQVAKGSSVFADAWMSRLAASGVQLWARSAQGSTSTAMFKDIQDVFTRTQPTSADPQVPAAVATPSTSPHPSKSPSPSGAPPARADATINMAELRAANGVQEDEAMDVCEPEDNGAGDSILQMALLRQCARATECELALSILQSAQLSPTQLLPLRRALQHQQSLVIPTHGRASTLSRSISMMNQMQQGYAAQMASTKLAFEQRLRQESDDLQDAEDEVSELRREIDLQHQDNQRLYCEIDAKQRSIDSLVNDQQALEHKLANMQKSYTTCLADCDEWKRECIKTRETLENSERLGIETRQQLVRLTEAQQEMQRVFDQKQSAWEGKAESMAENTGKLEAALGESMQRVRELEAAVEKERAENADLLSRREAMEQKLAEYARIVGSFQDVSKLPH